MTTHRDPDRLINAFLGEGSEQLDDQVYDAVRAEIERKRQRVVIGPWRVPNVSKLVPIGLGAAAVIGVLFLGSQFIGSPTGGIGGQGGQPTASAEPTATLEPTSTPATPTPSLLSAPPLSGSFTSTQHGISLSAPEGWTEQAATEPWTDMRSPASGEHVFDFLFDPLLHDGLFLAMASAPIGDATPEEWMAATLAPVGDGACAATEPIEVDGAAARIVIEGEGCPAYIAVVTSGGRGYWIELYPSDDDPAFAPYDRAWFEEVLATVRLHPEDTVDGGPSPPPQRVAKRRRRLRRGSTGGYWAGRALWACRPTRAGLRARRGDAIEDRPAEPLIPTSLLGERQLVARPVVFEGEATAI